MNQRLRWLPKTVLVASLLLFASAVLAQDKVDKCGHIEIVADINKGPGNWNNGAYVLKIQSAGGGWTIYEPADQRGQMMKVSPGMKLRFNVNDGQGRGLNVTPTTGRGKALEVRTGSRGAIILVDVHNSQSKQAGVNFTIDGSNNEKAKIGRCTGGNFFLELE